MLHGDRKCQSFVINSLSPGEWIKRGDRRFYQTVKANKLLTVQTCTKNLCTKKKENRHMFWQSTYWKTIKKLTNGLLPSIPPCFVPPLVPLP